MSDIAKRLRDMSALAADSCDPEFNRALIGAADEIERLRALMEDVLIVLESKWGKEAKPGSLIAEVRAAITRATTYKTAL